MNSKHRSAYPVEKQIMSDLIDTRGMINRYKSLLILSVPMSFRYNFVFALKKFHQLYMYDPLYTSYRVLLLKKYY